MLAYTSNPVKRRDRQYYDQNFTTSELHELIAFFSTPTGKKFASKSSDLADGLSQLAGKLLVTLTVQGAVHLGVDEIQKRGMVIPKPTVP